VQRGYKVYREVCSACHSMNLMYFRNLGQKGGPFYDPKYPNPNESPYVKSLAHDIQVKDIDQDTGDVISRPRHFRPTSFPAPFANEYAGPRLQRRRPAAGPLGDGQGARRRPSLHLFDPHRLWSAAGRPGPCRWASTTTPICRAT